jgi:hypothetical protein
MGVLHLQIVAALWSGPAGGTEASPSGVEQVPATRITTVILVAGPLSYRELEDALRIRLPRMRTLPYERRSFDEVGDEPYAYVELSEPSAPRGAIDIAVILGDGRSYGRRFVPDADDPVRDTATMLANTITAIEEERVQPIREDAEIPRPPAEEPPAKPKPKQTRPVEPARPRWGIGLTPAFGTVVGLAPRPVGEFGGGSVALDVLGRAPVGVVVGAGVRFATRRSLDVRLSRTRVQLAVGWAYRRRNFELLALGAFTVEPWLLTQTSDGGPLGVPDDEPVGPLLGGLGRVSPGFFLEPRATPSFALRIGLFAELAGSALPGVGAPRLVYADPPEPIARFGGLELATGLDTTLWFSVPRRR